MNQARSTAHKCYRCQPHGAEAPAESAELESIQATYAEDGGEVFFASGYSAREIAQKKAQETGGRVYVNNVSRSIKRPELTVPVAYAVAKSAVYTLRPPDDWHEALYRAYWPPLDVA